LCKRKGVIVVFCTEILSLSLSDSDWLHTRKGSIVFFFCTEILLLLILRAQCSHRSI
jgi:hypothetical protein